jgi:hypothetical protein
MRDKHCVKKQKHCKQRSLTDLFKCVTSLDKVMFQLGKKGWEPPLFPSVNCTTSVSFSASLSL